MTIRRKVITLYTPAIYTGLIFAARTTLPHFSVSSATNLPNAADVIEIGSYKTSPSLFCRAGSAGGGVVWRLSGSMISAGGSRRGPRPCHRGPPEPGPACTPVGRAGHDC